MKKTALVILAIITCVAWAGNSEAVLINYDGTGFGLVSSGDFPEILNYYAGLAGNPVHSGFNWVDYNGSTSSTFGPHSLTAMAFNLEAQESFVSWGQDVNNVSLYYGYNSFATNLSVQGYNDGVLVFDSGTLPVNSNGMFQYTAPNSSIDKLVFAGAPNYWTLDDLSYDAPGSPENPIIPEPMSLILFSGGLAGLTRLRKKRS